MTSSHPQGLGFNKPVGEALECLQAPRVYSNVQAESRTENRGFRVGGLKFEHSSESPGGLVRHKLGRGCGTPSF